MATICRANFALRSLARRALICRLYSNGSPAQEGPIGFIGLGNMGSPMAKNLLGAGQEIIVHDVARETVVDLKTLGAATAAAPSEVASKTSTIFTMLPSSPNVRDVYCGENGILSWAACAVNSNIAQKAEVLISRLNFRTVNCRITV
ncbi:hypothetical protein ACROYT_G024925 [Oculina patagonica]